MKHLLLIAIIFLTGCGALVPSTSRRSSTTAEAATSSVKSSEQFSKIVSGQQKPAMAQLHVGGLGNKVELKIPQVDQVQPVQVDVRAVGVPRVHDTQPESTAQQPYREEIRYASNVDAADAEKSASKERKDISIPIGVSIGLVGIGMLILLFAVNRVRKSSLAVNAAYQTFDGVLAQQIRSIRERAILATDNSTISMLNAQIADLEAQRGRLAR
jgi:hypothetical protein